MNVTLDIITGRYEGRDNDGKLIWFISAEVVEELKKFNIDDPISEFLRAHLACDRRNKDRRK